MAILKRFWGLFDTFEGRGELSTYYWEMVVSRGIVRMAAKRRVVDIMKEA